MYNPDENDIDRLSREAAEHYRAPGAPAWDALRQTLDKELPQEKEKKRRGFLFFFLLGLGLLVTGSGIWYAAKMHTSTLASVDKVADKNPESPTDKTNAAQTTQPAAKDNAKELTANSATSNISDTKKIIQAHAYSTADNTNNNKELADKATTQKVKEAQKSIPASDLSAHASPEKYIPAKNKTDYNIKPSPSGNNNASGLLQASVLKNKTRRDESALTTINSTVSKKNKGNKNSAGKSASNDKNIVANDTEVTNEAASNNTDKDKIKDNSDLNKNSTLIPSAVADNVTDDKAIAVKDKVALKPFSTTEKQDSAKPATAVIKSKSKNSKAILLGLTAGLDISTVKFTYGSSAGYNIGFMGGYQFGNHWSVYTGIVYTKKNYKLNGSDYHPPKDYWTTSSTIDLQTVEGYCRMWDLPLLARYTFNSSPKTAFFASAGLSSYFMRNQQYTYTYKMGNWPVTTSSWADDKSFNHIFSILDLSAGFEKQMGKNMNWQVEPYAKVPLGGVGFGNIKLSSFGINLTVQYKHPLKR